MTSMIGNETWQSFFDNFHDVVKVPRENCLTYPLFTIHYIIFTFLSNDIKRM